MALGETDPCHQTAPPRWEEGERATVTTCHGVEEDTERCQVSTDLRKAPCRVQLAFRVGAVRHRLPQPYMGNFRKQNLGLFRSRTDFFPSYYSLNLKYGSLDGISVYQAP